MQENLTFHSALDCSNYKGYGLYYFLSCIIQNAFLSTIPQIFYLIKQSLKVCLKIKNNKSEPLILQLITSPYHLALPGQDIDTLMKLVGPLTATDVDVLHYIKGD